MTTGEKRTNQKVLWYLSVLKQERPGSLTSLPALRPPPVGRDTQEPQEGSRRGTLRVVCSHGHRETPCAGQGHHPIRHASTGSTLGSHVPPSPSHHPCYQKPYRVCVGGRQRAPNSSTGGSRLCRWHGSLSCALSSPQTVQRLAGQGRARQGMGACVLGTPAWLSSYTAARPGACPSLPTPHPTFRHLPFVAWKLESNMATCVPTWVASPAPPSSATPP